MIDDKSSRTLTEWTGEVVIHVLRKEREVYDLLIDPYAVDLHEDDWARAVQDCKQLNAAFVHGFLVARRQECEGSQRGCVVTPPDTCCQRCGGSVVPK